MFGYVQANLEDLTPEEKSRYQQAYCGLCRTLGARHGLFAKFGLTYDLTFLTILLSSLYEPEEEAGSLRCVPHPWKEHPFMVNRFTEYASDLTVALVYFKGLDDWKDEKRLTRKLYADRLEKPYQQIKKLLPEKCRIIEEGLDILARLEEEKNPSPDAAAKCFGSIMQELFVYQEDHWAENLRILGNGLGRYIYLADAMIDRDQDLKKGNYNPLLNIDMDPISFRNVLMVILGSASEAFESLPLVQDVNLLRNILYSGLWLKYNRATQPSTPKENKKDDR